MPHLFIAVTAHGFGHVAQVAPIVHALCRRIPELRVTLQGRVSRAFVKARMPAGCRYIEQAADVALPMDDPLHTRWQAGLDLYTAFDAEHAHHLERQRTLLRQDLPDLLLADIPWLPLAAARDLGIPAVALCCLSWYDILAASPIGVLLPAALVEHMRSAYASADLFIRPAPSMPMAWLPNGHDIGPIAEPRPRDPAGLRARLGIQPDRRPVLMQFGGAGRLCLGDEQPLPADVHLLTPDAAVAERRDRVSVIGSGQGDGGNLHLLDALASCDAIITKPGYGTFAEAACNGIPVLYVPRGDWPEEPYLVDWLAKQVPTRAVSVEDFAAGRIAGPLQELLDSGPVAPVPATGVDEAVGLLAGYLLSDRPAG
jgi:UDP:flavonoid glycosyltransferase YjiC (YdhE family)